MKEFTLGIIGAGNMASAIVNGILKSKILEPSKILISDIDKAKLETFSKNGLNTCSDNIFLSKNCENILFAIKPQCSESIFDEIKDTVDAKTIISIMAGIKLEKIMAKINAENYVRVMPNTPALIGKGISALTFSNEVDDFSTKIFSSVGEIVILEESQFDAVTSVSGSGPAYIYMFLKGMIQGGVEGGLDFETSKKLAIQTMIGASEMFKSSDKNIDDLITAVCSKGGTTIQAVNHYTENNLVEIIAKGIEKCKIRSEELSK